MIVISVSAFASQSTKTNKQNDNTVKTEYILSVYDGRIAVFEVPDTKPVEFFDVYVSSLPYSEQTALENGIKAESRAELQRLIEDYTS